MIRSSRAQSENETLELLSLQISIVYDAIRSLVYSRVLQNIVEEGEKFWISTKSAHLQSFITSWAKCFGSSRESTHWKKSILVNSEFRRKLRLHVDLNAIRFEKYTKSMLSVRNQVLSHTDASVRITQIPNMDVALKSLLYLHGALKDECNKLEGIPEPILYKGPLCMDKWIENLSKEANELICTAHSATKGIAEHQ